LWRNVTTVLGWADYEVWSNLRASGDFPQRACV